MSAADRLLGLRVRIPPGAWMFVLVCCTEKDKRQGQDNHDKEVQIKYREQTKKIPLGARIIFSSFSCVA
jgi:hypothetical protein